MLMQRRRFLSTSAGGVACMASGVAAALLAAPAQAANKATRLAPLPPGYVVMGRKHGVPPLILYGVALQESKLLFGDQALPYPWTLCVRGEARRFPSYPAAVADLKRSVSSGITNVDCGCMQVNWGWNRQRLGSFSRALDPYPNLGVGAEILREHYEASKDWFRAVGQYHTGPIRTPEQEVRARSYATGVFARIPRIPGTAPVQRGLRNA